MVCGRFFVRSVGGLIGSRWSVVFMVGMGGGRLVMWVVVGVLRFHWSIVGGLWF